MVNTPPLPRCTHQHALIIPLQNHKHRARLESGIQNAKALAASVQQQQASILEAAAAEDAAAERARYDATLAQAAAEAEARVFHKDTTKLTMRERLAAKARREDILHRSVVGHNAPPAAGVGAG